MYRNNNKVAWALLLSILVLSGCRLTPQSKVIQRDHYSWITGKERVIAIVNLSADDSLKLPENFLAAIEADLSAYLPSKGYSTVIPQQRFDTIYYRHVPEDMSFFDPVTGHFLREKKQALESAAISEFRQLYQPDILLSFYFTPAAAEFAGNKARWDSVEDITVHPPNILWTAKNGTMPAISVVIQVHNLLTDKTYTRKQGVQTILDINAPYHIYPEDIPLHLQNLQEGIRQLTF